MAVLTGPGSAVDTGVRSHQQQLIPVRIAETMARRCRMIRLDRAARTRTLAAVRVELRAQGYSQAEAQEVVTSVDRRARREAFAAYARASGIDRRDRAALCAAARREIAASSVIGRYLNAVP